MKHIPSIIALLLFCLPVQTFARSNRLASLDSVVKHRDSFVKQKLSRISGLRAYYQSTEEKTEKYNTCYMLFKEYCKFDKDSAISYTRRMYHIASDMKDTDRQSKAKLSYVFMLAASGMYKECFDLLNEINLSVLSESTTYLYYKTLEYAYQGLQTYSDNRYHDIYTQKLDSVYHLMVKFVPQDSPAYTDGLLRLAFNMHRWDEAEALINKHLEQIPHGTNEHAMILYMLANVYKQQGKTQEYEGVLIEVAEIDLKTAVKEYRALTELAHWLFQKGDIKRAYWYSQCSLEDANAFNARQHSMEVAQMQPVINEAYQKHMQHSRQWLIFLIVSLTICILGLICLIKKLRQQMKIANEASSYKEAMIHHLSETNHVREEYIGHFIKLCSTYINKIDELRILVNRKLKANQTDDLMKYTSSRKMIDAVQTELFRQFDTSYLQLYPNFVKEVNKLLKPEEVFVLKKDELLNNELRICALVKLGIRDSAQISEILGYSPNTIYTYRTRIRNRAKNHEHFEEELANLCEPPRQTTDSVLY